MQSSQNEDASDPHSQLRISLMETCLKGPIMLHVAVSCVGEVARLHTLSSRI